MHGWQTHRLEDLCSIELGRTPARDDPRLWDKKRATGNVWLSISDLLEQEGGVVADSKEYVSDQGAGLCKLVPAGTLLLSFKLTIGRLAVAGRDLYTNEAIAALGIRNPDLLDRSYLRYFLEAFDWGKATEGDHKIKGRTLNKAKLKEISVLVPSLSEQHRIVAILDEALEGIATAKANAEKNLQNARELCEEIMQGLFPEDGTISPDAPSLDSLCDLIVDCEHKTAPTQEHGIPSIRTPNIGRGRLLLEGVYRVSDETYAEWTRRAEPQGGDLILAREAPAGNVAVIPEGTKVCLGQRTVLIRPRKTLLEPDYLAQLLLRRNSQQRLLAHSRGATVQHINLKDIRAFKIAAIPSLTEQRNVVEQVNELFEVEDRLVDIYRRKLAALDELKKSLLHQAFSGQL